MTHAVAILTDPKGQRHYLTSDHPGLTADPLRAMRFTSDRAAWRAANARIYGEPDAFWNSERESARLTREAHRGWTADVIEAPPLPPVEETDQ